MADKNFIVDINLNKNEIQNAVFQNLATAPANPKAGQFYYDTTLNKLLTFNGTSWEAGGKEYTFTSPGLTLNGTTVSLDNATASTLGGVVVGTNIDVSSGTISVKDASNSQKGVIQIATDAEVSTGTEEGKAVNPKQLKTGLDGKITANSAITGATKTKITYDEKGLVTAGTDLSASDIPNLTLAKITDVTATAAEINILDGATISTTELNYLDGVTSSVQTQLDGKVAANSAITGATHSKITYDSKGLVTAGSDLALTDLGVNATASELNYSQGVTSNIQDQLDALAGRGKLLAVWNPVTGLPSTSPGTIPYTYSTGDYYIVGNPGTTNYKPTGTQYTGAASTTVETGAIAANDTYIFDGTTWTLLHTEQPTTTWGSITGTLSSQTDLQNALDNKVTKNSSITAGTATKITYDAKGLVTGGTSLSASDIPDLSSTYLTPTNTATVSNKTISADSNTISNLEVDNFGSGVIQTTIRSTSSATDTALATEKAIATALESKIEKFTVTNPILTTVGGVCTWTISNSIGNADVALSLKEVSTGEEVYAEVVYSASTITVKINSTSDIVASTYKAVVIG